MITKRAGNPRNQKQNSNATQQKILSIENLGTAAGLAGIASGVFLAPAIGVPLTVIGAAAGAYALNRKLRLSKKIEDESRARKATQGTHRREAVINKNSPE